MTDQPRAPKPLRVVVEVSRNGLVDTYADPGVAVYLYDAGNVQAQDQPPPGAKRGWSGGKPGEVDRALKRLWGDLLERLEEGSF